MKSYKKVDKCCQDNRKYKFCNLVRTKKLQKIPTLDKCHTPTQICGSELETLAGSRTSRPHNCRGTILPRLSTPPPHKEGWHCLDGYKQAWPGRRPCNCRQRCDLAKAFDTFPTQGRVALLGGLYPDLAESILRYIFSAGSGYSTTGGLLLAITTGR